MSWRVFSGIILMFIASICFAFQGVIAKYAYAENVTTLSLLTMRYIIALPVIAIFALYKSGLNTILKVDRKSVLYCLLAGVLGYYAASLCDFYSMTMIDAGIARVLYATFPAFVIIFSAIKNRSFPPAKHMIIFIFLQIGVFMMTDSWGTNNEINFNVKGGLVSIGAAFFYALHVLLNEQESKVGSVNFVLFMVIAATFTTVFTFVVLEPIGDLFPNSKVNFYAFLFALVGTIVPWICFAESINRLGGALGSLISMMDPVITLIVTNIFLDEYLTLYQLLGSMIIILSLIFLMIRIPSFKEKGQKIILESGI